MNVTRESDMSPQDPHEAVVPSEPVPVFATYRTELDAWYEREGGADERPTLGLAEVPEQERAQLTPADVALLPIGSVLSASRDDELKSTLADETRQALEVLAAEYQPRTAGVHTRVARWLVEARRRFSFDESPAGTPDGEETVWLAAARRQPSPRRQPHPRRTSATNPTRGTWVMLEPVPEPDASDRVRATYDRMDEAMVAARQKLRQEAIERKQRQEAIAERRRLEAKRERVVTQVVQERRFGWLIEQLNAEFPEVVQGVIKTIETARERAYQQGTSIPDGAIYAAYFGDVHAGGQPSRERLAAFCTMHALMDGKPDGPLPSSLAV